MKLPEIHIIADSGSTKTNWCITGTRHGIVTVQTIGLNPYFIDASKVEDVIERDIFPYIEPTIIAEVDFYGSGCTATEKVLMMETSLKRKFPNATVTVYSDLLGACRALCGSEPGIAGILGTGSNTCVYDGNNIIDQIRSLGYILGDEGSGAVLGKMLVKSFYEESMPEELRDEFAAEFGSNLNFTLDSVYKQPFPNRYLATMAPFANRNKKHPWMHNLLIDHFDDFFRTMVLVYKKHLDLPVSLVGSVAHHFSDILDFVASKNNLKIGRIELSPMDGLMAFHRVQE